MSKKNAADQTLREVFESPEYREALKARLLDGTAKKSEIDLARSLGLVVDESTGARENLRRMDRQALRVLMDINRLSLTPASPELRLIRAGDVVGVGYSASTRARKDAEQRTAWNAKPEAGTVSTDDLDDLLPKKRTRT